jgi:alkylhydroperoxidase family enzyme
VLDDASSAHVSDRIRAMLLFLKKLTLEPEAIGPVDAEQVLAAGVSREEIRDAIYVAFLFNVYDRLADTLDWHVPIDEAFEVSANSLLKRGYK